MLDNDINLTLLYDDVDRLASLYRDELVNCGAVASGNLVNFKTDISFDGKNIQVSFVLPTYYGAIEEGRKPTTQGKGHALYDAIRQWLAVKSIQPLHGMTRETLAYLISRKIHREGFFGKDHHGKHPLRNALEKAQAEGLFEEIATSVADQFGEQMRVELKDILKSK